MTAPPLTNDRLLRALARQPVDATPVWLMRQAGRYLPEYRATRQRAGDFLTLCQTPELACEVTLQPIARFPLDAAILFSDILTVPDAMGLGLFFVEGEGPRLAHPVRTKADVDRLPVVDPEDALGYVTAAVRLIRHELAGRVPLIGFAGSPWTLATYMVEGGSSRDFARVKGLAFEDPALLHRLLAVTTQNVTAYLNAQIAAGAQAVMIFDTWGGVLTPPHFQRFSLDYMAAIVANLQRQAQQRPVPVILFTKGGGPWLESLAAIGAAALGVAWTIALASARARVGARVARQGTLEPSARYAGES
ncbi:MAG: uroporphyrinogen decarboxylase, partial [Candidatus Competibacterales bacterium]